MPTKIVTSYFSKKGVPQTGLSPVIKITEITPTSNNVVVPAGAMLSVGDGIYKYIFVSYDYSKNYTMFVDGGATLGTDRYQVTANESYQEDISSQVYEEPTISHNTPGSMGELFTSISTLVDVLLKYAENRTKIDTVTKTLTVYDDDGITPIRIFQLKDAAGNPSITSIFERI